MSRIFRFLVAWLCCVSINAATITVRGPVRHAAAAGGGTPTFVQDDGASFDPFNSARSVTFGSSTASGNAIIAIYKGSNAASLVVSDNKSNSYTVHVDGASSGLAIASALNVTGGASHQLTFTVTSHANPGDIIVMEYSNVATSGAFDQGAQGGSSFEANRSLTTGTLAQATELLIGVLSKGGAAPTAGAGFTLRQSQGSTYVEEGISSATTAQTIGFVHAEATCQISVATFKGN